MPSRSDRDAAPLRATRVAWTLGLLGLSAGLAAGCSSPQSGLFAAAWCHPTAAEGAATVMLDDMEDGDSVPCAGGGKWTVEGNGDFSPETVGGPATPVELDPTDEAVRSPSTRAEHLAGTLPAGGWGGLLMPLAQPDLTGFKEIDFWAKTTLPTATIRVGLFTTDQSYFSTDVMVQSTWGYGGLINNAALQALLAPDGTPITAAQLATGASLSFRFLSDENAGATGFEFWIDDVQAKRTGS